MKTGRLPRSVIFRMFLRSFFLQASWNFERMQNLGVLYMLAPALRFFYRESELQEAFHRHLVYFNTHPFMAGPVLGSALALEEERARGLDTAIGSGEFKEMVMAPFAAMGDALFWGGLRPLAAVLALFLAFKGSLWGPVVFLLLFNLPHLWFRLAGLFRGYYSGLRMVEVVQKRHLPDWAIRAKEATIVLLGGLCAYLTMVCLREENLATGWGLAFLPVVVLYGWLTRKGLSNLFLMTGTATLLICVGFYL